MLSMPPATTISTEPATRASWPRIAASIAEPHILLTVVQPVECGSPPFSEACRAGACPWPAGSTQPKIVLSTSAGLTPARSTAALIATAPRSLAASGAKTPWKPPIGVRAAPTMTMGSLLMIGPRSFRLFEELAADQHAADLRRAGADLVELGVAPQTPGRELVDVAVAAETLNRLAGHPRRLLGRMENRAGGILARRLAAVARLADRVDVGAAGVHRRVHVGELALHQLELADRLAELPALVQVWQHRVEACRHDAERAAGEHRTLVVEPAHQHVDAAAHSAEHIGVGNEAIVEHELAGVGAAHAELVEFLRSRETLHALLDD